MLVAKSWISRLCLVYDRFFGIDEIGYSERLQWIYYSFIAGFIFSLNGLRTAWVGARTGLGKYGVYCPDYFQSCENWIPFNGFPRSYDYDCFMTLVVIAMGTSVLFALKKNWRGAHFFLGIIFVVDSSLELLFQGGSPRAGLTPYLLVPCVPFLFFRNKMDNLRLIFVLMYVFSGLEKLYETWITGTYFSSLAIGMPLVPDSLIPIASNLVIVLELAISWLLLSSWERMRNTAVAAFLCFHAYSLILVGPRYPLLCVPILAALFIGAKSFDARKVTWGGAVFMLMLTAFNLRPLFYKSDTKATFEGVNLAVSMFDANRQTRVMLTVHGKNGTSRDILYGHRNSYVRMSPLATWSFIQHLCRRENVDRIEWKQDVSVNGKPFRRIIDEADACQLTYQAFAHNEWIHDDGPEIGYPLPNYYNPMREDHLEKPIVSPTPVIVRTSTQDWLASHCRGLSIFYLILSLATVTFVMTTQVRRPA